MDQRVLGFYFNEMFFCCFVSFNLICFLFHFTVQGSHRDSIKQNKDLATLAQPASSSSNSHNNAVASKFVSNADADSSKSGPYFDVAASKNVSNGTPILNLSF